LIGESLRPLGSLFLSNFSSPVGAATSVESVDGVLQLVVELFESSSE
jgi:hypothetical protein